MSVPAPPARRARVFTIPPGVRFVDALASGLWEEAGRDPLTLARARVLLPTRRASRALGEAFLRLRGGAPILMPLLVAIGDVDDDELALGASGADAHDLAPAIGELRRRMLLARAILALPEGLRRAPEGALALAAELARLLDQFQTERVEFALLATLVPDAYASHWQLTLDFLKILVEHWPAVLAEEGALDPAERRHLALTALVRSWQDAPPPGPVYVAGSTGTVPATALLIQAVAALTRGAVILPGLERDLDDESWAAIEETHPQFSLKRLLERLGIERRDVPDWPHVDRADRDQRAQRVRAARQALAREALLPALTTSRWRALGPEFAKVVAGALEGLSRIDCAHPQQEAATIALILRDALSVPGRTAALITPDRALAQRVAAELGRYKIKVDDSAGRALALTPPGAYLRLVAGMVAQDASPVALLACLKHPLAAGGLARGAFLAQARRLEKLVLRGARPLAGFAGLLAALEALPAERADPELAAWLRELAVLARPFADLLGGAAPPAELLRAHVALAEALAASEAEPAPSRLWAGEAGEALAALVGELALAARDFPPIAGASYAAFFESCLDGQVVRPAYGGHPRLKILGPLEARLIGADIVILGGLNDGTWPPQPAPDPWLSRPMRAGLGLPSPERRVGLSAHDFAQAFAAPEVVLTRAERVEGAPTLPSRWLLRLDAVLVAAGHVPLGVEELLRNVAGWAARLDAGPRLPAPGPPAPRPPLAARPRRLSVTEIETWLRDPYAIYARRVLDLAALEPLDADPGAAERGLFIHAALDDFVRAFPGAPPEDALARLLELGRRRFGPALARPGVAAFWWPRFERIARWFIDLHSRRRREGTRALASEVRGRLAFASPGGSFELHAKADRIDRLADGKLAIIDYKTGVLPSAKQRALGFAPQLPLEAAIARAGGFAGVAGAAVAELSYWHLTGREADGAQVAYDAASSDIDALAQAALDGLKHLVACFDLPETPYHARPRPDFAPRYSDYDHLARVKEWAALDNQ